jgi:hypothetical protein
LRLSGRCKPVLGSCEKNFLFFTPAQTQAEQFSVPRASNDLIAPLLSGTPLGDRGFHGAM